MEPRTHTVSLSCDAAAAFEAFTDRISDWWPEAYTPDPDAFDGVVIEPRVGGRVLMRMAGGDDVLLGEVTAWEPGRVYAQTWTLWQDPDAPSSLTVSFTDSDSGTGTGTGTGTGCVVVLEHGGWHEANAAYRQKFGDWDLILERYAFVATT